MLSHSWIDWTVSHLKILTNFEWYISKSRASECAPAFSNPGQKGHGLFQFYIVLTYEKIQYQLKKHLTSGFQESNPQKTYFLYQNLRVDGSFKVNFVSPITAIFFSLILNYFIHEKIKVKNSWDFLVWVRKSRRVLWDSSIFKFSKCHHICSAYLVSVQWRAIQTALLAVSEVN